MALSKNPACNSACSACHYKEFDYSEQLFRKQRWAELQLDSWRLVLAPIEPAPEADRIAYRAKTWLRSSFQDGKLSLGMYRAVNVRGEWAQEFISWDTCPIHIQSIQEMTTRIRAALSQRASEFCEHSLFGIWMGSPHLVIVAREGDLDLLRALDWKQILVPPFERAWFHRTHQVGRKVFQHREFLPLTVVSGADEYPILAFRQMARTLLIKARAQAVEALLSRGSPLVLDLYCGTGELASLLPATVGWLGIELSRDAVHFANQALSVPGVMREAWVGSIEHRLCDKGLVQKIEGPYSIYLNPPRTGLSFEARDRVMELLGQKPPENIVYLSCSASSLARDLKAFEHQGYRVTRLQPFDFFPQTEHFETLAILSR